MNCKTVVKLLSAYLDDEVDTARKKSIRDHLEECDHCRHSLAELSRISLAIRDFVPINPPPRFEDVLLTRVHAPEPQKQSSFLTYVLNPSPRFALGVCIPILLLVMVLISFDLVPFHPRQTKPFQANSSPLISSPPTTLVPNQAHRSLHFVGNPQTQSQLNNLWPQPDFSLRSRTTFPLITDNANSDPFQDIHADLKRIMNEVAFMHEFALLNGKSGYSSPRNLCPNCFKQLEKLTFVPASHPPSRTLISQPDNHPLYEDNLVFTHFGEQ